MNIKSFALLFSLLAATACVAADSTVYDAQGRRAGSATRTAIAATGAIPAADNRTAASPATIYAAA